MNSKRVIVEQINFLMVNQHSLDLLNCIYTSRRCKGSISEKSDCISQLYPKNQENHIEPHNPSTIQRIQAKNVHLP